MLTWFDCMTLATTSAVLFSMAQDHHGVVLGCSQLEPTFDFLSQASLWSVNVASGIHASMAISHAVILSGIQASCPTCQKVCS